MCENKNFLKLHLTIKIDLVEVVYYLKQVFNLLHDMNDTPEEVLHYLSLMSEIIVSYDNMKC